MKHAYLILAHGQWELLRTLLATLDDERNDIFVHIDAKVKDMPFLSTCKAGLKVLDKRVDVRWGDVSVVEAEYNLFNAAVSSGPYEYYHLLSGQDLPLKSQDEIHSFFHSNAGKEFVGYTLTEMTPELVRKVRLWHLFPGSFRKRNILRSSFLRIQEVLGIQRNRKIDFKKGSQWVSLTDAGARVFLEGYPSMRKTFTHTFCADEIAVHTLIWDSSLKKNIYSLYSDAEGCKRAIGWRDGCLYDWSEKDYDTLAASGAMFARKFNLSDRDFIRKTVALSIPGQERKGGPAISVIMPVYNAADSLERSLESLKAQTFKDFEVIFIDDCSTDGSSSILEEFARNSGIGCRILRQDVNGGVALARNRGMEAARGEYIAWMDADDALLPDTLEKAFDAAHSVVPGEDDADIVGFDWRLGFQKNSRYMRQADWSTPLEALKALCGGTARWNLWLFLLKRKFVESAGLKFSAGANMGEDMAFMIKAFANASKVVQIHDALYLYNALNSSSISKSLSKVRRREIETNISEAQRSIEASPYAEVLQPYIDFLKLYLKLPLLISDRTEDYRLWHSWMAEANPMAAKNKALPLRTRILQWMAWKKLWAGVRIYYIFVYKFVYGIIFR